MSGETEIKVTIEKLAGRSRETGETKRTSYVESVDGEGTIHRTTEIEQSVHDCGHAGESGGACHVCGRFTVCAGCARDNRFACSNCKRLACPDCARESLLQPGVRICRKCGVRGVIRSSLARRP